MKSYAMFIVLITCLFLGMLTWFMDTRSQDFKAYHTSIAQESAAGVANEIARLVSEKKRLVKLFAGEHLDLIQKLARNPDDESLHQQLEQRVAAYFPDYFAFTVIDSNGELYVEDYDGLIGDLCRQDIETFANSVTQHPRIHPHSEVYHFDVMAFFGAQGAEGILFISFHADVLGNVLNSAQTPGHQLMLLFPEASELIEVTSDGARINWDRDDYRLLAPEKKRILYRQEVPGTVWDAVDLHKPALFIDYRADLFKQSALIFALFMIVSIAMLFYVRREEILRRSAEQHKDEFLSVVSHELRTPLTSIRGSLSLLTHQVTTTLDPQAKSLADIALKNTLHLESIVNDILDVQKIEAGKMEFDLQPVELTPLIKRCIINNVAYGQQFGCTFSFRDPPSGITVRVDQGRLEQVMANLLSNAAKYGAQHEQVDITIAEYGDRVRINVTDHGPGIPESSLDSLFQKFMQIDSSSTRDVGGTGLGLSIVKLIVEKHGGQVGVESRVGSGSTFYFELPRYTSAVDLAPSTENLSDPA